jgi:hypothetical protein
LREYVEVSLGSRKASAGVNVQFKQSKRKTSQEERTMTYKQNERTASPVVSFSRCFKSRLAYKSRREQIYKMETEASVRYTSHSTLPP